MLKLFVSRNLIDWFILRQSIIPVEAPIYFLIFSGKITRSSLQTFGMDIERKKSDDEGLEEFME